MDKKDFVNFDLAVKLKEKGFSIPFYFFYRTDDKLIHHGMVGQPLTYSDNVDDEVVIAPTIMQVAKWLRDTYQLHIEPYIHTKISKDADRNKYWVLRILNIDSDYKIYDADNVVYNSYEDAMIAGIEYILNRNDLLISGNHKTTDIRTTFED